MLILIDADPIVYRCGFASEQTSWHLVYETEAGDVDEIEFTPDEDTSAGDKMRAWLALNKVTVLAKYRVVKPDPVSYALRATKVQIESIISECEDHFKQPSKMLMWISGKGGTYRDRIATVRPYKGNRDPTHKPYHYDAIRDYLRTQYGSYITRGIEADDAVSIFARNINQREGGESVVICTIDKDLDQIPGNHYNYMNKVFYAITNTEAETWFIYQILAGDPTDNIIGVWRCGASAARAIVNELLRAKAGGTRHPAGDVAAEESESAGPRGPLAMAADATNAEHTAARHDIQSSVPYWWNTVVSEYQLSQRKPGCPYAKDNPEAIAIEMAQLVKLQEYPGQLWHPHGDLVVPGFGEEDFDG